MLDHVLQFKGEPKRVNNKFGEDIFYILAHNGSGFDSYVVLNNRTQWRTVVSLIRNGSGIVSLKNFHGSVDGNKKNPQFVLFRCGQFHIKISLKKQHRC